MKRRLEFTVTPETAGKTVRRFLQEELSFSGHQISRLKFQEEGIRVDGKKVYVSHVLREGEVLTVGLTEQVLRRDTEGGRPGKIWEAPAPELSKYPLQVLYEDSDLLIVNKPAGMVCHPSPGHFSDTLANQAAAHLGGTGTAMDMRVTGRLDKDTSGIVKSVLSPSVYPGTIDFLRNCHNIMLRYIIFDVLDGIIIGVSNGLFMAAAGMPYVVLVSVLVGITNLAPTFGPFVGGIVGALILLLVNPWYALWFLLFTLILQTIDGYILKPKLFGDSLGVPAVWVLVSIIFFGRLFGILGVIISIPLAAIVNYTYQTRIVDRLRKRRENNELQRSILKAKESERDKSMKA